MPTMRPPPRTVPVPARAGMARAAGRDGASGAAARAARSGRDGLGRPAGRLTRDQQAAGRRPSGPRRRPPPPCRQQRRRAQRQRRQSRRGAGPGSTGPGGAKAAERSGRPAAGLSGRPVRAGVRRSARSPRSSPAAGRAGPLRRTRSPGTPARTRPRPRTGCIRAPRLTTLASLCSRASRAVSADQASAARIPLTLLAAICSPLPDPPITMPRLSGSAATALAARIT